MSTNYDPYPDGPTPSIISRGFLMARGDFLFIQGNTSKGVFFFNSFKERGFTVSFSRSRPDKTRWDSVQEISANQFCALWSLLSGA